MVYQHRKKNISSKDTRLNSIKWCVVVFGGVIIVKLFFLQVIDHDFYVKAAENRHSLVKDLKPTRGQIYLQDIKYSNKLYPLALNKDIYTIIADPKTAQEKNKDIKSEAALLAQKLNLTEQEVLTKLTKEKSRYEIIDKRVAIDTIEQLKLENLQGISFEREDARFYPEKELASQLVGYLGYDEKKNARGFYGLEGYENDLLSGQTGFISAERDAQGGALTLIPGVKKDAVDGADLILTIDRTIENVACEALKAGIIKYQAKSGTVVIMNPKTGAILAMCNEPSFDPNNYNQVKDFRVFNNDAIFTPYEPGSVFKIITMAAALDSGKVTPGTTYVDTGELKFGKYFIHNAALKKYGLQTMTGVLKESINTGAVFAAQKVGFEGFKKYVNDFGFGVLSGIDLDKESAGNISALNTNKDLDLATASFGQGITATPLQLTSAFAAIANHGNLYKPYIIAETHYADGHIDTTMPRLVKQVISEKAAGLLCGMMAVVVNEGHGKAAAVPGYYIGGKTGTAQIAGPNGYIENQTNQTFIGFGPVEDPQFVMLVKYVEPQVLYAESSAVPTFGEIAKFLVQYLEIPPSK